MELSIDIYNEITQYLDLPDQLKMRILCQACMKHIKTTLLTEFYEYKKKHRCNKLYFPTICQMGYLQLAKWYSTFSYISKRTKNNAFQSSCRNGHIRVAKWLSLLDIDISADNHHAFRMSCANGHIDVAKWLYQFGGVDLLIGYAFRLSCANGHIEVAKWLYELGKVRGSSTINIHELDDHVFRPKFY
jgi:translation initiation factor IF-1